MSSSMPTVPFSHSEPRLILVDSTRAGKRIPDALSKTVPIWCAVINAAILLKFPEEVDKQNWDVSLHTPPTSVSRQEHDQIEKLLPGWAVALNVRLSNPQITDLL